MSKEVTEVLGVSSQTTQSVAGHMEGMPWSAIQTFLRDQDTHSSLLGMLLAVGSQLSTSPGADAKGNSSLGRSMTGQSRVTGTCLKGQPSFSGPCEIS